MVKGFQAVYCGFGYINHSIYLDLRNQELPLKIQKHLWYKVLFWLVTSAGKQLLYIGGIFEEISLI